MQLSEMIESRKKKINDITNESKILKEISITEKFFWNVLILNDRQT